VGVTGVQLDAGVIQLLEPREDRGQVPVNRNVVGDDAQLAHRATPLP